nr:MAG TPA: hypothetical protein [Caudoviricetes sp.]
MPAPCGLFLRLPAGNLYATLLLHLVGRVLY